MGKRSRARARQGRQAEPLGAPATADYTGRDGQVLTLRGALTARTRRRYAETLAGNPLSQEDAWQRAVELLFEHLAVRWVVAGVPAEGQRELLQRYRVATQDERRWIRDVLRAHLAEHFPELPSP
jgi:hypothetical protein